MLSLSSHVAGLSPLPIYNLSSVTALPMEYGENDNVLISGPSLLEINSFLFLFLETLSLGPLKHHTRNLTTLRVPVWEVRGRQTGKESELVHPLILARQAVKLYDGVLAYSCHPSDEFHQVTSVNSSERGRIVQRRPAWISSSPNHRTWSNCCFCH